MAANQRNMTCDLNANLWGKVKGNWSLLVMYLVHLSYWRSLAKVRGELANDRMKGELLHCCSPPLSSGCANNVSSASLTCVSQRTLGLKRDTAWPRTHTWREAPAEATFFLLCYTARTTKTGSSVSYKLAQHCWSPSVHNVVFAWS